MTQGMRTVAYQDKLYAQGRTIPGQIVTYVRGGESWHNYGLAFDIGLFTEGFKKYIGNSTVYTDIGIALAEQFPDIVWGGKFPKYFGGTFIDKPHYEYHPGYSVEGGARQLLAYKDHPFDAPIVLPADPDLPVPNVEFDTAWDAMLARNVATKYTVHDKPVTTDELFVFFNRLITSLRNDGIS
jgi:hypothetical protein